MAITKPTLPPKKGYVEVEVNGARTYRNVETGELIGHETVPTDKRRLESLEEENALLKAQVTAQSEQMDFYEDCIAEMAEAVYA